MAKTKKRWLIPILVMVTSCGILRVLGREIHLKARPVPDRVVSDSGTVLFTGGDIETGRQAWQSAVVMQLGSIWGRGPYPARNRSADWLHRESVILLDGWSTNDFGAPFASLNPERQSAVQARLRAEMATRSAEFLHSPLIETLVWLRVPGDTMFAAGGAVLAWFAFNLWRGRARTPAAIPAGRPIARPAG